MTSPTDPEGSPTPSAEWDLPAAAGFGSSVRLSGIEREIRARLPWAQRPGLSVETGRIVLRLPEADADALAAAARIVGETVARLDTLPVLPRELEDILAITAHERQKWTKDGRLQSAGTRTVKLRGRAKAVTFHVFDPRHVEDVLDRDLPSLWREEDRQAGAETRRRAAAKAAETRAGRGAGKPAAPQARPPRDETPRPRLEGWDAFAGTGLLR
ncbi:hypothetical protein [Aureimonas endophytica]|nr:hypothetical protein [Aureimonas endophytica]